MASKPRFPDLFPGKPDFTNSPHMFKKFGNTPRFARLGRCYASAHINRMFGSRTRSPGFDWVIETLQGCGSMWPRAGNAVLRLCAQIQRHFARPRNVRQEKADHFRRRSSQARSDIVGFRQHVLLHAATQKHSHASLVPLPAHPVKPPECRLPALF